MNTKTELLTDKELASLLKCSQPAIRVWRRQGLPTYYIGKLVRFNFEEVLTWFRKRSAN